MAELGLAWGGPVLVAMAWAVVRFTRASVWVVMGATLGPLGALAALLGDVRAGGELAVAPAVGIGIAAGVALYGATAGFMWVARGWAWLARHTGALYRERRRLPAAAGLAVAVLVVAPGEELLWRGLVQHTLASPAGTLGAAVGTWVVYTAVNAVAGSLPILLGGAVAGAAWGALAWWTGGVLASALCHMVWTAMMILVPPVYAEVPDP